MIASTQSRRYRYFQYLSTVVFVLLIFSIIFAAPAEQRIIVLISLGWILSSLALNLIIFYLKKEINPSLRIILPLQIILAAIWWFALNHLVYIQVLSIAVVMMIYYGVGIFLLLLWVAQQFFGHRTNS